MKANKPKLMNEKVKLNYINDSNKQLEISLLARVLGIQLSLESSKYPFTFPKSYIIFTGKGQGTPMLKDGIHCVSVEQDEESEVSDWQGFEWNKKERKADEQLPPDVPLQSQDYLD